MPIPYLTVDQIQERYPSSTGDVDVDGLVRLVAEFEDIAERYVGVAQTPRTRTVTDVVRDVDVWAAPDIKIRSVASVTVDGVALAGFTVDGRNGIVYLCGCVSGTLVATYDHGFDAPPEALLRACGEYVSSVCMSDASGTSRNIIGQSVDGSYIRYSTPDWNAGRPTGWLEVDRLLNSLMDDKIPGIG